MKKKKTIAFVIHSLASGGAERVVSTLSNNLVNDYHVIVVNLIANTPFYPLDDRVKLIHCNCKIQRSKNSWQAIKLNHALYTEIKNIFKIQEVDLAIGFMTTANVLAILAAKTNKIPVLISERIDPIHSETNFVWRQIKKWIYPKADYLIVQTERIKEFFVPMMSEKKLVILPNPISKELMPIESQKSPRENMVLNVGRLTDQKGQDILIKAFAGLDFPDWELVIIGEGPNREAYQRIITQFNKESQISLVGQTKNISDYYNKAKIFAFTSHFEGFPNALIEAMYMGLACISTDCPTGPSELIEDGKNGYLIEVRDQKALSEKLRILMNDQKRIENYSRAAQISTVKFKAENVIIEWKKTISMAMGD